MAVWPTSLPAGLINTLSESPPDNVLRTSMDRGPAKLRRTTTTNIRPIAFSMILTKAQTQTIDDFYTTTTFSGAEAFDYTHPRTGVACSARFVAPPSYSDINGLVFRCDVSLEILP